MTALLLGAGACSDADTSLPDIAARPATDASPLSGAAGAEDPLGGYAFTTLESQPATLAQFAGRPLVLNFFASWCVPCLAEMPDLEEVHQSTKDEVAFLGLAVRDDAAAAQAIVEETGVTYPTGLDSEELLVDFDGFGMPTTVFISAAGEIVDSHVGELSQGELRDKLADNFGVVP
jgi:thiol-disulfide isomerase/thioredoxin